MRRTSWWTSALPLVVLALSSSCPAQTPKDNAARFREVFIQLDSNGDTVLEREEIPESGRAAFDRLLKRGDTNKNGKLEADELRALGQKVAVLNEMPVVLARFKGMDKDGDGKVTRAEFTGVPANFDRIDADKDGSLSREEITKFFSARAGKAKADLPKAKAKAEAKKDEGTKKDEPKPNPEPKQADAKSRAERESAELNQRFKFLDRDGDGKISKSEFLGEKLFDRLDTNKDGFLSPSELAKYMKPEE